MSRLSRRAFVVTLSLPAALRILRAQNPAPGMDDDVLLRSMRDELQRSRQIRVASVPAAAGPGDDVPYFISYSVGDSDDFSVSASLGAVTSSSRNRFRLPQVEVRVGSYEFDNTGHVFSGLYTGSRFDTQPWPIENDYMSLRQSLWLATDHAFKAAVESLARKRASLSNVAGQAERLPDYSQAEPAVSLAKAAPAPVDEAAWTARIAKLSAIFAAYPSIRASGVEVHINQGTTYYMNTEGTTLRYPDNVLWMIARAEGQASDGMPVRDGISMQALQLGNLAGESEMARAVTALAERVTARVNAPAPPPGETYSGPVLFEPLAAAQLFAQLLGDNLRVQRRPVSDPNRPSNFVSSELESRINARILPEWFDVVDDPTQAEFQGKPLVGGYPYDLEGVAPKPVSVVEKGVLKNFLTTRQPGRAWSGSNGRARLPGGGGTRGAAISNLFARASRAQPLTELKARLIQMCNDRSKPYGILVRRLDFPFAATGADLQALMAASTQSGGSVRAVSPPVLIYRVYPDGREELVRGLRFRGVSTRSLREIEAASTETSLFDFISNGSPLALLGGFGMLAPASVVAPGLLFEEIELERPQEPLPKPVIVPPPGRTGA